MGQVISKAYSLAAREVKSYNVERRAQKVISKDKPIPAPKHPSTIREIEQLESGGISIEHLHKKDEQLNQHLKNVFVTSSDPAPSVKREVNPERPLPQMRQYSGDNHYGYTESEEITVPEGRLSLKQALKMITEHKTEPEKYDKPTIAMQYKISLEATNDILEHFKLFNVHLKKNEVDPEKLSEYEKLTLKVKGMTMYNMDTVLKELADKKMIEINWKNKINSEIKELKNKINLNSDNSKMSNSNKDGEGSR